MMNKFRFSPWMIPLSAALIIAVIGWWSLASLENTLRNSLANELHTVLNSEVASLRLWLETQQSVVEGIAAAPPIPSLIAQLESSAAAPALTPDSLRAMPGQNELSRSLLPVIAAQSYEAFAVINNNQMIISSGASQGVGRGTTVGPDETLGQQYKAIPDDQWAKVLSGVTVVVLPRQYQTPAERGKGIARTAMFIATPIQNERGEFIAALAFRLRPQAIFARILNVAIFGNSGETYAFNSNGMMISESRFIDQLRRVGLLSDSSEATSTLNISVRNPGGNRLQGFKPSVPTSAQPLTRMAADAIAGNQGTDVEGYLDYRGVMVVGAWTWLPRYGFGVATEVDLDEAFATRTLVRRAFWTVLALLILSAAAMFAYSRMVQRLQQRVKKAQKLGQYTLEEKVGEGGMGSVYKARHAMLRRPTAIKLIKSDSVNEQMVLRFEREVQLTSQLTHPNTIAIYDYGRTPDGIFYYAMEYLTGITLDSLVEIYGPQPERRVVFILRQLCSSLAEAHSTGLIHRDIKPANIMLCERGGLHDVVKVLDFGLVKELDGRGAPGITAVNEISGTPLYMAPEMIMTPELVDARSDLYAVGAVAYFLIVGAPIYSGRSIAEVLTSQVNEPPPLPSARLGRQVDPHLEALILRCLAKSPADRPADAREVLALLDGEVSESLGHWTEAEARQWWDSHIERIRAKPAAVESTSLGMQPTIDINMSDRLASYPSTTSHDKPA